MVDLKEQHVCKKFCFKMGENATEILKMLKVAFVGQARGTTQVFEWFAKFKNSVMPHSEDFLQRSKQMNILMKQVKELVLENRGITVHEAANMLGILLASVESI